MKWQVLIDEFDDAFANKWSIKCERMCSRFAVEPGGYESNYGPIYKLCEFMWKLKVWKP